MFFSHLTWRREGKAPYLGSEYEVSGTGRWLLWLKIWLWSQPRGGGYGVEGDLRLMEGRHRGDRGSRKEAQRGKWWELTGDMGESVGAKGKGSSCLIPTPHCLPHTSPSTCYFTIPLSVPPCDSTLCPPLPTPLLPSPTTWPPATALLTTAVVGEQI